MTPTVWVRPLASREALGETTYPSSSAIATIRARVCSDTVGRPRSARETVAVDTPARWATSLRLLSPTGAPFCSVRGPTPGDAPAPAAAVQARGLRPVIVDDPSPEARPIPWYPRVLTYHRPTRSWRA